MDNNTKKRVAQVLSALFDVTPESITESSSPDTISAWDSLGHMNMVVGLEEEFGVQFTIEQTLEMMNFELVCVTVDEVLENK